ncbi:hypothetical protein [Flavilitoribacter nigricans]|uniref:Uncharacterized protein n=1 Tax=Flavilitoribacter nigricans (strain ATCC 23147 / DSM 23189 / NBRC 102662 / NCIMB 1420 / SS-2) TaxID=1122177 RepID=A0A2D0MWU0_FLAN2|nr:hypothetical protein [Flavilitoribacter nigricans]PHN00705.1 hypothetical protein CRP01_40850 [Flavilitoribacter nigricans DSM 23189 = NBRC 102662]
MAKPSKKSYLEAKAKQFNITRNEIVNSEHAITIYKKTLEAIADVLSDPNYNLAEHQPEFLEVIRSDIAQISQYLRKYRGTDPSRADINVVKGYLDSAISQISVVAKRFKNKSIGPEEELKCVKMLQACGGNLDIAVHYFGGFLLLFTLF